MEEKYRVRNRYTYGLGTFGRDMVYTMISMYLMFYLTDILNLPAGDIWWITGIMLFARIFDAMNDPVMGVIVDNTHTRWGRFKPWIVIGLAFAALFSVLLFTDFGLTGGAYIIVFGVIYVLWGISYTMNDIAYWSMIPSLTKDQKEREKMGAIARICADVGLFLVVALLVPVTEALGEALGSMQRGYYVFVLILVVIMIAFQLITVFGVREPAQGQDAGTSPEQAHTSLREMVRVIFKNDQLLIAAIAMTLYMTGYCTTTSFGLYYFKYVYGNEDVYTLFAVVLGVSQIAALSVFPALSKRWNRRSLYFFSTILVTAGYLLFFFSPGGMIIPVAAAGILIFVGEAFMQLMMLMFLRDTVEYGEWKFHKRNDSVTLSLQPFINKFGGAIASGITGATVIISGMKTAETAADMTAQGIVILKTAMLILPLILIIAGFVLHRKKYILDEEMYARVVRENEERRAGSDAK